jgi:hypothetical protein
LAGLDEAPHGLPMTNQRSKRYVAGIRMCIKVNYSNLAPSAGSSNTRDIGPGDGVITPQYKGYCTCLSDFFYDNFQVRAGASRITAVKLYVTCINHFHVFESIDTQCKRGAAPVMLQIASCPERTGTKPGTRSIGRPTIKRRPDNDYIGITVRIWHVQVAFGDTQKSEVRSKLRAISAHVVTLSPLA